MFCIDITHFKARSAAFLVKIRVISLQSAAVHGMIEQIFPDSYMKEAHFMIVTAMVGAVFLDIKGYPFGPYSPTGTNIGTVSLPTAAWPAMSRKISAR